MTTFSVQATHNFFLDTHHNKASLKQAVTGLPYVTGGTNLADGLRNVSNGQFNSARPGYPNILIVLTDGQPDSEPAARAQWEALKNNSVEIFSIGVGSINQDILRDMSSSPQVQINKSIDN